MLNSHKLLLKLLAILQPSLTSKMELFVRIVNDIKLTFSQKRSIKYFFLLIYKFLFLPIFKNYLQVLLHKTFILIQTNI